MCESCDLWSVIKVSSNRPDIQTDDLIISHLLSATSHRIVNISVGESALEVLNFDIDTQIHNLSPLTKLPCQWKFYGQSFQCEDNMLMLLILSTCFHHSINVKIEESYSLHTFNIND